MRRTALLFLLGILIMPSAFAQAPPTLPAKAPVPNVRAPVAPVVQPSVAPAPAGHQLPGVVGEGVAGMARVVDGDTIRVDGRTFRLWGIDAPEVVQPCQRDGMAYACGRSAAAYLRTLLSPAIPTGDRTLDAASAQVVCVPRASDRYGRTAALCRAGTMDLGAEMVRAGWALVLTRHGTDYAPEEEDARQALRGLWAGSFDTPWGWRAKKLGE